MYMLFQVVGAFIGAGILMALAPESGLGANAVQEGICVGGAVAAEVVFTFIFVLVVLGSTDAEKGCRQSCWLGHRFVVGARTLGMYPLHRYISKPSSFDRPSRFGRWSGVV